MHFTTLRGTVLAAAFLLASTPPRAVADDELEMTMRPFFQWVTKHPGPARPGEVRNVVYVTVTVHMQAYVGSPTKPGLEPSCRCYATGFATWHGGVLKATLTPHFGPSFEKSDAKGVEISINPTGDVTFMGSMQPDKFRFTAKFKPDHTHGLLTKVLLNRS